MALRRRGSSRDFVEIDISFGEARELCKCSDVDCVASSDGNRGLCELFSAGRGPSSLVALVGGDILLMGGCDSATGDDGRGIEAGGPASALDS